MIDIHQLRVFMAVWRCCSFSKAAEMVHLTQPTVSTHIRALEDVLGVRLFDRNGRDVTPTRAGSLLYPYARQILRLSDQAEKEVSLLLGREKGTLEAGGSNIPGQYILPGLLGDFKKIYPDIYMSLRIGDTTSIVASVASGEMEIGVVGAVIEKKKLVFEPCFDDELILIVSPDHRFAEFSEVDPNELRGEAFVIREQGSGTRLATERAFESAGSSVFNEFNVIAEIGSTEAVKQAVRAGLGCTIISRRAVKDDIDQGLLCSLSIKGMDFHRQFYLIWHDRRTLSPIASAFRDFILGGG